MKENNRQNINRIKFLLLAILLLSNINVFAHFLYVSNTDSLLIIFKQRLSQANLENVVINEIQIVDSGSFLPATTSEKYTNLPRFCRVAATITPSSTSVIHIEVWLPVDYWNNNFLGTGNGGGAGKIAYENLVAGIRKGYATANTDMGTSRGEADSAIGNPEVWIDFGYRATHLMTVISKSVVLCFYGEIQKFAYFVGCSTGGQQALMEAQRFPGDYNGIIAGAPANNRTHLHTMFLWNYLMSQQQSLFNEAELSFIARKIAAVYYEASGGAPGDTFLTDPRLVDVDFEKLFKCGTKSNDTCLTITQINTLKKIYQGPINPMTRERIYTSMPAGSEKEGGGLSLQQTSAGVDGLLYPFKWVFGKKFDVRNFDFDRDQATLDSVLAYCLNANNPDLSLFKKMGGRLIMYTGTADPLVPFQDAVNYYERVIARTGGLNKTKRFFRYFLIPGMAHCNGGPGLTGFDHDLLTDLNAWVEQEIAPVKLIAVASNCCIDNGPPRLKRPIFPYPQFPHYTKGDVSSAQSYKRVNHKRRQVVEPALKYLQ